MHTVFKHKPILLPLQPIHMLKEDPIHMVTELLKHLIPDQLMQLTIHPPIILVPEQPILLILSLEVINMAASVAIASSVSMISKACIVILIVPMAETEATADMAVKVATVVALVAMTAIT